MLQPRTVLVEINLAQTAIEISPQKNLRIAA